MSTAIVWFRRDLRLEDNPAWAAATEAHDEVVPVAFPYFGNREHDHFAGTDHDSVLERAVPAKKVKSTSTGFGKDFEEIRDRTNFWSSKGIMDSVPKVNGIITPKTPVN